MIGYLNWFGIPWNFKWLWAPLVDMTVSLRSWVVRVADACEDRPPGGPRPSFIILAGVA